MYTTNARLKKELKRLSNKPSNVICVEIFKSINLNKDYKYLLCS